ncbi:helix-turn-helix domain-containing protein [Salmonella enterica subsp. enterica serovar Typhimurium]|nr:helix-turn-helix domain-containing protein [Salmonella enterica subsp. enterica serovar Typhimurium]
MRTYKYRLCQTIDQAEFLAQTYDCVPLICNAVLHWHISIFIAQCEAGSRIFGHPDYNVCCNVNVTKLSISQLSNKMEQMWPLYAGILKQLIEYQWLRMF